MKEINVRSKKTVKQIYIVYMLDRLIKLKLYEVLMKYLNIK